MVVTCGRRPPSQENAAVTSGDRYCWNSSCSRTRFPEASRVSRLRASCTVPVAVPPRGTNSGTVSRSRPVVASSSESKPIRLSATRENCIWPPCGDAQPKVPAPAALAPFHSAYAVSSRMTLSWIPPRAKTLSIIHSRTRPRVRATWRSASGARSVSILPVTRSSPANEVRRSRPVSAARSRRENRSSRFSAPHLGGSMVANPVAVTLPISPSRSVFTISRERVPSP